MWAPGTDEPSSHFEMVWQHHAQPLRQLFLKRALLLSQLRFGGLHHLPIRQSVRRGIALGCSYESPRQIRGYRGEWGTGSAEGFRHGERRDQAPGESAQPSILFHVLYPCHVPEDVGKDGLVAHIGQEANIALVVGFHDIAHFHTKSPAELRIIAAFKVAKPAS